ncbi:hypothetical protein HYH02_004038 [Chlamydomonas schloesseri]|uniref:Uncharacterized protein n=1 Tax=Chlamydomonas schloesseri TaxID=2026947 RepID=A0A835WRT0_9CHLO|nr:hypothetical protein HYH02_004038 [Chlamydomonas schloesseri]|eukprot:KAG2451440.1 hypothetical protein HYH02_004038 [Chlamydomonas schloesseri]
MPQDKALSGALGGDPRRPDQVTPWKRPAPDEEKLEPLATAGMVLGLVGMFLKMRIFSFLALAFIISAFIQRSPETDLKQLSMSFMFSVSGILFGYLAPQGAAAARAAQREAAQAQADATMAAAAAGVPGA